MSNTRYHSIGLKVKEKQESNLGRQSDDRMRENSREKANLKRWVLSFEWNVETDNELRVSGGRKNFGDKVQIRNRTKVVEIIIRKRRFFE